MAKDDETKNSETDSFLLSVTKKWVMPLLLGGMVTGVAWVAKSINEGISDIKVISTNLANTTNDLEKLATRYENMNEKYHKLENMMTELKIRLEVSKLENMEASLSLVESVEMLREYTAKIPLSKQHKSVKDLPPKPTHDGAFKDYNHRIIEQRKLVDDLRIVE